MRKRLKKKFQWKTLVTGLGIVCSLLVIGEASVKVWMWINRPLLEVSYVGMTGECLDRFMTAQPAPDMGSSKQRFGPPGMGLNSVLNAAFSEIDRRGATVSSAVFLTLKNVANRQMTRLDVITPMGAAAAYHVSPQEQIVLCVRITYKDGKTRDVNISKVAFETGEGQKHAIEVGPLNTDSFTPASPTNDCIVFGATPTRPVDVK